MNELDCDTVSKGRRNNTDHMLRRSANIKVRVRENPMSKKVICVALGAMLFALCVPVAAQQPKKVPRIGYLSGSDSS